MWSQYLLLEAHRAADARGQRMSVLYCLSFPSLPPWPLSCRLLHSSANSSSLPLHSILLHQLYFHSLSSLLITVSSSCCFLPAPRKCCFCDDLSSTFNDFIKVTKQILLDYLSDQCFEVGNKAHLQVWRWGVSRQLFLHWWNNKAVNCWVMFELFSDLRSQTQIRRAKAGGWSRG